VYRGCAMPDMNGVYFFADYCSNHIRSFRYSPGGGITELTDRTTELDPPGTLAIGTITSFGEDAFGEIYICDQGSAAANGEVFKIVPNIAVAPDCNANGRQDQCDILAGTSIDCNADGIPDECQSGL